MEITLKAYENWDVLNIKGRVDHTTAPQLTTAFEAAFQRKRYQLRLDLTELEYLSSAGLRAMINAQRECRRKGGELKLDNIPENIRPVLELTGFTEVFLADEEMSAPGEPLADAGFPDDPTIDGPDPEV